MTKVTKTRTSESVDTVYQAFGGTEFKDQKECEKYENGAEGVILSKFNTMRKLASIRIVSDIMPIKGKDRVELAIVDGWTCMVSKADDFKKGSLCVFCEPDSVFPQTEQWEFLKKYNYHIKTQKFKDADGNVVYSQGLVLPMSTPQIRVLSNVTVGRDVTEELGIKQYEPPMDNELTPGIVTKNRFHKWLMRNKWYRKLFNPKKLSNKFPSFISRTDEERIQNCPNIVNMDTEWIATEKIDGQSGTFAVVKHKFLFWNKYEFIVCSRNLRKPRPDGTSYWQVAERYNIKKVLIDYLKWHPYMQWVAIQGECIAPNVQGNKYKVNKADLYIFNLIDSVFGRYNSVVACNMTACWGLKFVPIIEEHLDLHGKTVDDLLKYATGKSALADGLREGIVFRSNDARNSFKAVSPEFLIKYNE